MKPLAATVTLPEPTACPYCGMGHLGTCPRVKAMEYHPDGTLKRVEFHGPQTVQQITHRPSVPSMWGDRPFRPVTTWGGGPGNA